MSDVRLFARAGEAGAARILQILSATFEEEGYAVATSEIDEAAELWEVSVYTSAGEAGTVLRRMREALSETFPALAIDREDLPDIDWVTHSLDGLKPVRAGRILVHGAHDRDAVRPGDIAIEIEAGRAFGTGHHGTTSACLDMITRALKACPARHAVDLGTGSGVLAIALARLSTATILATDNDPVAIEVARGNVAKNGASGRVKLKVANGLSDPAFSAHGPFDLVVANILARPLMALAPQVLRHTADGGRVIVSGILATQRWKVLAAYNAQRFRHVATITREGWVTMLLARGR